MNRFCFLLLAMLMAHGMMAQKVEAVFRDKADSSHDSYLVFLPEKVPVRGLLFLLDGFGGNDIPRQTALPQLAAQRGLVTVLATLKTGPFYFGVDDASQASLREQIEEVTQRYRLAGKPLYLGGFSIGGTCALKYAQEAAASGAPQPKAVFAVDPPLDFERYYEGARREVRLSAGNRPNEEAVYMIGRLEQEMGGSPQTALAAYHRLSPYSQSDTTQRAVKTLLHTPLLLFTEPDIQWWLKERRYDYYSLNAPDCAGLVNELQRLGNKNAVLRTTSGKGYRAPDHRRHPHSWSIADPKEVLDWLLQP